MWPGDINIVEERERYVKKTTKKPKSETELDPISKLLELAKMNLAKMKWTTIVSHSVIILVGVIIAEKFFIYHLCKIPDYYTIQMILPAFEDWKNIFTFGDWIYILTLSICTACFLGAVELIYRKFLEKKIRWIILIVLCVLISVIISNFLKLQLFNAIMIFICSITLTGLYVILARNPFTMDGRELAKIVLNYNNKKYRPVVWVVEPSTAILAIACIMLLIANVGASIPQNYSLLKGKIIIERSGNKALVSTYSICTTKSDVKYILVDKSHLEIINTEDALMTPLQGPKMFLTADKIDW